MDSCSMMGPEPGFDNIVCPVSGSNTTSSQQRLIPGIRHDQDMSMPVVNSERNPARGNRAQQQQQQQQSSDSIVPSSWFQRVNEKSLLSRPSSSFVRAVASMSRFSSRVSMSQRAAPRALLLFEDHPPEAHDPGPIGSRSFASSFKSVQRIQMTNELARRNRTLMNFGIDLDNPIHQGYLLRYCVTEFNAENIQLFMDVDRLGDSMSEDTLPVWKGCNWREVDKHVELLESRAGADDPAYQHALGKLSSIMLTMRLHGVADNAAPRWPPKELPLGVSRSGLGRAPRHGAWGVDNNSIVTRTGSFDEKKTQGTPNTATAKHLRDALILGAVEARHAGKMKADQEINRIWNTYIQDDSPRQVCTSPAAVARTRRRAKYFQLYGPDVFSEVLEDAVKTIKRDIAARYVKSDVCRRMLAFERDMYPLPPGETLDCPPPSRALFTAADMDILPQKKFTCRELVSDRLLYQHFQNYLGATGGRDKLLGVRMLSIFEERVTVKDWGHAEEVAWDIYCYFVAPGAAYEVPLDVRDVREIQRRLADPQAHMFEAVSAPLCVALKDRFQNFAQSRTYRDLNAVVMASLRPKELIIVKSGCMWF